MKETIFYKRDLLFQGADGPYSAAVRVFIDRCGMYVYVYKRDLDIWKETSKSDLRVLFTPNGGGKTTLKKKTM